MTHFSFRLAAITHKGNIRENNEDSVAIDQAILNGDMGQPTTRILSSNMPHLLMIADGMGGHAQGALASQVALKTMIEKWPFFAARSACMEAVLSADARLYELMQSQPELRG